MPVESGPQARSGMATMEIMIAFAILALGLAAALPAVFSGRSLLSDAEERAEALDQARQSLDLASAQADVDFQSVNSTTTTLGIYLRTLRVQQAGLWTKRVTSVVSWRAPSGRISDVRLSTLLTNRDLEDSCGSVVSGDWKHPRAAAFDFADLVGDATGSYAITGVDAYRGKLYVTTSGERAKQATFFIFDVNDPDHPKLTAKIDNDPAVETGPKAVAVAPSGGSLYAYLASASSFTRGQLQVVDVTNPSAAGWAPRVVTYKIPASIVPRAGLGNSIFYRRGYAYLGLTAADGGKEFDIIDVHDPLHPIWKGGYSLLGHAVNAIRVRGGYAYLAHPAGSADKKEQLTILNIADPARPRRVSGFYWDGGIGGHGKSVSAVGGRIYLGRTSSRISGAKDAIPEFFALDGSDPESLPGGPLGSIALATAESVNGLVIRDVLAFLLTSTQLQIWDISDVAAPKAWTPHAREDEFMPLPGEGTSMDCEGDTIYIGSNTDANRGFLTIVTPRP